ncbi:MAG: HAD family hydrolase [bacterium]
MIRALVFDLDGTLVQTESLKAVSYARAAVELCPNHLNEEEVIEGFKDVVGLSRQEVARSLMQHFNLEEGARARMTEFGVQTPWQAFIQVRLRIYDELLADPQILHDHLCPCNVGLLRYARGEGFKTGLATMSYCTQVNRVLEILELKNDFDFIASRDDVELGKPDPEVYFLVARQLGVTPSECLVIEDSSSGIKAALAAGMQCIAVTTDFTRDAVHASELIDYRWIVDDPAKLQSVAEQILHER